ncbi:MAG: ABC transporter substrate-binding protein [Clostridiales bacterium]|nr:ABC transporter substrate-binding protein [Clostridiales bacterium]
MKKLIYILLAIVVIIIIVSILVINLSNTTSPTSPNITSPTKLEKISVSEVTHSIFYAPQYVAMNLGFFEEEGLEIELINGGGADNVMTAVLSNQVDIGFAGPEAAIYVYNEGKEDYAEVFAQVTKRDGSFLVAREKTDNFSWTDLKGKHVLPGRKGGAPYMTFEYVLKQNGLDIVNDLNLDTSISFDAMNSSFVGGTADYVTSFEPAASLLEKEGAGYIVAAVGSATEEIPYTAYFAKKSYIEKNSDIIQKFTNAIYKGQVWVNQHSSEEIADATISSFPDSDKELLTKAIENYKKIDVWNTTPYMSEDSFNLLQKVIMEAGELDTMAPYNKIVNNTFAENVKK